MNKKNYSIFLCALLASTFAHELNSKCECIKKPQVPKIPKSHDRGKPSSSSVTVQVQKEIIIITNSSAGSAFLIDIENSKFVLLNGTSGSCVCVDRKSNTGCHIPNGVWNSDSQSIEDFVLSLENGLTDFQTRDGATQFELDSVSEEILLEVSSIVIGLTDTFAEVFIGDITLGLNFAITIFDGFIELFGGVLLGGLELFGGFVLAVTGGISGFLNILQGFASVIERVAGSFSEVIEQGVQLELAPILGAAHGLEALIHLFTQLGENFSLEPLSNDVGDPEGLFNLISQLGGHSNTGVSGSFKVAREVVSYCNGNQSLDVVIDYAVKYLAHCKRSNPQDHSADYRRNLNELLHALETINGSGNLDNTIQIINDLIDDRLTVNGINISQIINLFIEAAFTPVEIFLEVIVDFLLLFVGVVDLFISIPYLLLVLISRLQSPAGIAELEAIGIEITEGFVGAFGGILGSIVLGIGDIFGLFVGGFFAALSGLTVIGDIVLALNSAVQRCTHNENNLQNILESNSLSRDLIEGLFQSVSGHEPKNATAANEAQKVVETCNNVNSYVSVEIIKIVEVSSSS